MSGRTRLLLAAVLVVACAEGHPAPEPVLRPPAPDELPDEAEFLAEIDRTRGHRDIFPVIRDPEFVPAPAAPLMRPGELVLGLDLGSVQFAYPVNLLNFHEIVEHSAAGLDLLVCW